MKYLKIYALKNHIYMAFDTKILQKIMNRCYKELRTNTIDYKNIFMTVKLSLSASFETNDLIAGTFLFIFGDNTCHYSFY